MGTKNILVIYLLCLIFSCKTDFKEAIQVSLNAQESKEKNVFVSEYKIDNEQVLCDNNNFPVVSVWEEKYWYLALDNNGNEIYKIVDTLTHHLVFELNKKNTQINDSNFTKGNWVLFMDDRDRPISSIRGMINFSLQNEQLKDTTSFTIYKKSIPNDINNNLIPLYRFQLIRK